jgi:hypothetical protein
LLFRTFRNEYGIRVIHLAQFIRLRRCWERASGLSWRSWRIFSRKMRFAKLYSRASLRNMLHYYPQPILERCLVLIRRLILINLYSFKFQSIILFDIVQSSTVTSKLQSIASYRSIQPTSSFRKKISKVFQYRTWLPKISINAIC